MNKTKFLYKWYLLATLGRSKNGLRRSSKVRYKYTRHARHRGFKGLCIGRSRKLQEKITDLDGSLRGASLRASRLLWLVNQASNVNAAGSVLSLGRWLRLLGNLLWRRADWWQLI